MRRALADQFAEDVAHHAVQILQDDGLRRHLRCREGNAYCMGFDLITWPGHLCYTGDMGTYVLSRVEDMFAFFRGDRVNPDYWSEKVLAEDRHGQVRAFSDARFRAAVVDDVRRACRNYALSRSDRRLLMQQVRAELLSEDYRSVDDALRAIDGFGFRDDYNRAVDVFVDFWDRGLEDFTPRFRWACHAIVWAIARYDELREAQRTSVR